MRDLALDRVRVRWEAMQMSMSGSCGSKMRLRGSIIWRVRPRKTWLIFLSYALAERDANT